MNVASLENCKRLYKVSGWGSVNYEIMDTAEAYFIYDDLSNVTLPYRVKGSHNDYQSWNSKRAGDGTFIPAYDLGYLLRKLPRTIQKPDKRFKTQIQFNLVHQWAYISEKLGGGVKDTWSAFYDSTSGIASIVHSDTPENAACLLAIKLFEEGILTKES